MKLSAWVGPVALFQVPGAAVPGSETGNIQCRGRFPGVEPPYCDDTVAAMRGADGLYLPGLIAAAGLDPAKVDEVFLGSFSAGHQIVKPVLMSARDRAPVRAVVLADSTYMPASKVAPESYVRFGLDCLDAQKLFIAVATNIPGGAGLPSGSDTIASMVTEIEKRTGRNFEVGGAFGEVSPQPVTLYRLGGIYLADYQGTVTHEGTAAIAAQAWKSILNPWYAACPRPMPKPREDWTARLVALAAGLAAGYAGLRWWLRRRRA